MSNTPQPNQPTQTLALTIGVIVIIACCLCLLVAAFLWLLAPAICIPDIGPSPCPFY